MWFEHAKYKEKIKFMFDDELSIENVTFELFAYYGCSKLRIRLHIKNIPKVYPEEWKLHKFNTLSISLTFIDVFDFECKGGKVCCECSPKIISTVESATLLVETEDFYLRCVARYMDIDEIRPFFECSCDYCR